MGGFVDTSVCLMGPLTWHFACVAKSSGSGVSFASAGNNGAYENLKWADFLLFAFKYKELDSIRIKEINHKVLAHACAHKRGVGSKFK